MAKPTLENTRWAVTGGGSEATNQSAPISGLKDTGYADGAKPTAKNVNYLFRKIHAWFQWLDGLFGSDGSLTLDSGADLNVSGDGNINQTGTGRIHSALGFAGTGATPSVHNYGVLLHDDLSFDNNWDVEMPFHSLDGFNVILGDEYVQSSAASWYWKSQVLPLRVGDRVTQVSTYWSAKTGSVVLKLVEVDAATASVNVLGTTTLPGSGAGIYTLTVGSPQAVRVRKRQYVIMDATGGGGASTDACRSLRVLYDHPAP